jgi:hypothetical protein
MCPRNSKIEPKSAWAWVRALLHSVQDQPDSVSVHVQWTGMRRYINLDVLAKSCLTTLEAIPPEEVTLTAGQVRPPRARTASAM